NSILDFSKIEDGKMDIIPVKYDTASFINDIVNSVLQRAESKGLAFNIQIDKSIPCTLIGDDMRFSQVIINLLTNAVKYTEKGSVTFTLKTSQITGNKIKLFVSVKDTGIGIKDEDLGRLFESFERLDEIRNHNIEGTGLGISIVTSLLSMMGSSLHVESTYRQGSDFSFVLEQEIADATPIGDYEKRLKEISNRRNSEELINAPKAKILLVDDNDMNLKVARNLLKLCHIKSDTASSGTEAIDIMREKNYDIVFLDHMMPTLDGIETLHILREENLIPDNTTMIALTANAVVGAMESYINEGFDGYLSKPIELKNLIKTLKTYLPGEAYEEDTDNAASAETNDEEEVLEFLPDDNISSDISGSSYDYDILKDAGIDKELGISYCAGDENFYNEILGDFAANCSNKVLSLEDSYMNQNWHDYSVLVHAMKSNTKMIGATALSNAAKELEDAANKEDVDFIDKNHNVFISSYKKLAGLLN
ncbi:MAG: response regulator, partial [Lachnospiraceae bacterium]|nr:response regulator [Lachnospiraceae bacterium]